MRCLATYSLILLIVSSSLLADEPAIRLENLSGLGGGLSVAYNEGWEFSLSKPVSVTHLGVYADGKRLKADMPVGIWNSEGELLASTTVPKGVTSRKPEMFVYAPITPVKLEAGSNYVIAAHYQKGSPVWTISSNAGSFSTTGAVKWTRSQRSSGEELAIPELPKHQDLQDPFRETMPGSFGPNFLIADDTDVAKLPRWFYTTREVQFDTRNQTLVKQVPPGDSNPEFLPPTVVLYSKANGDLTQIVLDGVPLGTGPEGFERLVEEARKSTVESQGWTPLGQSARSIPKVAYSGNVRATDLRWAMNAMHRGYVGDNASPNSGRGCDLLSLGSLRSKQPYQDGKFIDPERFREGGDFVEDRWTGLLWQKSGESGKMGFRSAGRYAASLKLGGMTGWRVPTCDEYYMIFPADFAPFTGSNYNPAACCQGPQEFASYWTSEWVGPVEGNSAYIFHWYLDGGGNNCGINNDGYVRCVHDAVPQE